MADVAGITYDNRSNRNQIGVVGLRYALVTSHYAVFGNSYLHQHDSVIRRVQFGFEDIHTMFGRRGGDAFGDIAFPDRRIVDAIEQYKPDYAPSIIEQDKSMVLYFTGKFDLLPTTQTDIGVVSANRGLITQTSVGGISIDDYPRIEIEFGDDHVTLDVAVGHVFKVRQFFAWMLGYAPKLSKVAVFAHDDPDNPYESLDVFLSHSGGTTHSEYQFGGSMLISPTEHAHHFMDVMKRWIRRSHELTRANDMFSSMMRGMSTTVLENRMCDAANVFSLLPDKHQRSTLVKTARHRYVNKVRSYLRLDGMEKVIESAVNCRHYVTHGSTRPTDKTFGADYNNHRTMSFLTEALRFVYLMSELIECNWDPKEWKKYADWNRHSIGGIVEYYDQAVAEAFPQGL